MEGVSIREYAKHRAQRGLQPASKSAVQRALDAGYIGRIPGGGIDPAAADRDWSKALGGPAAIPKPAPLFEPAEIESAIDYRELLAHIGRAIEPEKTYTVDEWADRYRRLPGKTSVEPGPYRTSRTPYLREIMRHLSNGDPTETVVVQKGAQLGLTEAGNNWLGYIIDHAPGPAMLVMPTVEMAKRASKQRIGPMIEGSRRLRRLVRPARSRDSGNTLFEKEFPGGTLAITGSNSAVGLRQMSVRYLFLDEVDGYVADVDGEGDPVDLARKRTAAFGRKRKVYLCSTPTVKGLSRIERAFLRSDQRFYYVPCPECGDYDRITWERIHWPKDRPHEAALLCHACGCLIEEHHKTKMLAHGEWRATVTDGDPTVAGYHISGLYSPFGWYSWAEAAKEFLEAKTAGLEALKTWTNTVLGDTWEEAGDEVLPDPLMARRERYIAEVPAGGRVLICSVDLQDDRFEVEVRAWNRTESWGIEKRVFWGDPEKQDLWDELDAYLDGTYEHELGHRMRISAAGIDSGFKTQRVYEFCRSRWARNVWALKGRAGGGLPAISAPRRTKTGRRKQPVPVFTVGVDGCKETLYSRLRLPEPGPGYQHYPDDPNAGYGAEYFAQLTAERRITRYVRGTPSVVWVKMRPRNEALDLWVYSWATLVNLNPDWKAYDVRFGTPAEPRQGQKPNRKRGPQRSTFVGGFKR